MNLDSLEALVAAFERGDLAPERWNHAAHLAVATWYLTHHPDPETGIREGIMAYNAHQGIEQTAHGGYHDTLTRFLVAGMAAFLAALPRASLDARIEAVWTHFADFRGDVLAHYSRERIDGWPARMGWITPDRATMTHWRQTCAQRARG